MKNVLVFVVMTLISIQIFAQHFTSKSRYDRMMSKSRERRTTAFILLDGGAVVTAGGALLFNSGLSNGDGKSVLVFFLTGVGIGSMSASIPFFAGAHRARKKAISMSIKTESTSLLYKSGFSRQFYPALTVQIPFSR